MIYIPRYGELEKPNYINYSFMTQINMIREDKIILEMNDYMIRLEIDMIVSY